jgi:hypothetical protein
LSSCLPFAGIRKNFAKHHGRRSLLILFFLCVPSLAQQTPWWELYGGFQFTGYQTVQMQKLVNSTASAAGFLTPTIGDHVSMLGWDFSAQENKNSWFGGIIDFSGGYGSKNVTFSQLGKASLVSSFKPSLFTMGGGPQFTYRKKERVQPFFRMIAAAAYSNLNPDTNTANILSGIHPPPSTSDTNLALIFGGGVDYQATRYAFFRFSGDYIHTFVFSESESSYRLTAGIDFRIGSR